MGLFEKLQERGYIYQTTNEEEVKKLLNGEPTVAYVGIDPTGESLHIGHCFPLIIAKYLQEAGHKVIVLLGGATAKIGDPSGKNAMRAMVDDDFINTNLASIKNIIGKFVDLNGSNPAIIVNNNDWFKDVKFVEFMREIGQHFNVNKMLASDACATRLASGGLTFFEMGYMLMQAYDFVELNRRYGCRLEFGGSDQWANILAGADLGRKLAIQEGKNAETFQAFTNPLLTNSEGIKMGKTVGGAVWVLEEKFSVYDFYQYFYNVDDKDVEKLLKLLTRVPLNEISELVNSDIIKAKRVLAFEITKLVHGEEKAKIAEQTAYEIFKNGDVSNAPTVEINQSEIENGMNITNLLEIIGLVKSRSEARRMIEQGAISLNNNKITDFNMNVTANDFNDGYAVAKKGKKNIIKVVLK